MISQFELRRAVRRVRAGQKVDVLFRPITRYECRRTERRRIKKFQLDLQPLVRFAGWDFFVIALPEIIGFELVE